jgi:hypothetical protein
MPHQVTLDNHTFTLVHRTNKRIKRVSLQLENKDEIIIKTPLKFKAHLLKDIVYEHKEWILRSINKVPYKNQFDFITGGEIPFLGKHYPMNLQKDPSIKTVKFSFHEEFFLVKHNPQSGYDDFIDGLKKFYKYNAIKIIDPIFDEWCHKTKQYPNNITYRSAKTRWGSCSGRNDISINYKLLQFEKKCIEYVVLHELCHIMHKNHSKQFWDMVSSFMPEYKNIEKKIKSKLF